MALKNLILHRSAVRGGTQIRHVVKFHKTNTLHRTVQTQAEDIPGASTTQILPKHLHFRFQTRQFLISGRKTPHTIPCSAFQAAAVASGSVLVASAPLSSRSAGAWQTRRGWQRCQRNEQLEKEVHGNSWWVFDPISSPSGSGHSHRGLQV